MNRQTRNISFKIDDGTDPVENATVTIGAKSGTTGSAGGCTLTDIPDGDNTVTVTAEGFVDYTDTITVSADDTEFTISLTASTELNPDPLEPEQGAGG